jgi:hypothetical protein
MMKCVAIDDEPLGLDLLAAYCKKISNIDLVAKFTNVDKAKEGVAAAVVAAHVGIDTEPTIDDKLASVGLSLNDLKAALGI